MTRKSIIAELRRLDDAWKNAKTNDPGKHQRALAHYVSENLDEILELLTNK